MPSLATKDSVSYPQSEFVGTGKCFVGIERTHGTSPPLLRCSIRRHATRTHQPYSWRAGEPAPALLRTISHVLRGIPQPFMAIRSLRMYIVVGRRGLQDAPNREYRDKSILLDVTHADSQAQVPLRGRKLTTAN